MTLTFARRFSTQDPTHTRCFFASRASRWGGALALLLPVLLSGAARAQTSAAPAAPATEAPATPGAPPATAAPGAAAPAAEAKPKPWYDELSLNAFLSAGYLFNLNRPSTRLNTLRVFDAEDNTFSIGVVQLSLAKAVAAPSDVGFRVDADFGGVIPSRTVAAGDFPGNVDLRQAFGSWMMPVGSGLRLDVGKFVTHHGYEVIEGYDGYNDNYSRSFLFDYAIPFTHTGARLSYVVSPKISAMVMVANGWDAALAKQKGKMVGAQVTLTPLEPLSLVVNYCGGPENIAPGQDQFRHLVDVVAIFKVTPQVTFGLNGDYGLEKGTSTVKPGANAIWYGGAAYLSFAAASGYGLALRGEVFKDEGGTRLAPLAPTTVYEGTATASYKVSTRLVMRGEFRIDASADPIYRKNDGTLGTTQPTVAANTLVVF